MSLLPHCIFHPKIGIFCVWTSYPHIFCYCAGCFPMIKYVFVDKHITYWTYCLLVVFIAQEKSRGSCLCIRISPGWSNCSLSATTTLNLQKACLNESLLITRKRRFVLFVCWFPCIFPAVIAVIMCKCHAFCPVDSHWTKTESHLD